MENGALLFSKVLNCLVTPVWILDVKTKTIIWGNKKALELWGVDTLEELVNRDLTEPNESSFRAVEVCLQQYEKEIKQFGFSTSHHTDVWTIYPKDNRPPTATSIRCTTSGIPLSEYDKWLLFHSSSTSPSSPSPPSSSSPPFCPSSSGCGESMVYLLVQASVSEDYLANESRSREIIRNTTANLSLFSSVGTCLVENPVAHQTYGQAPLKDRFVDQVNLDEVNKLFSALGEPYEADALMNTTHPEEKVRWFSINARSIRDPVTSSNVVLLHTTDVHEFRKSQNKLSRVEEVAKIGTWEFNPRDDNFSGSPQFFKHFGCDPSRRTISSVDLLKLIHPDDFRKMNSIRSNYLQGIVGTGELIVKVQPEDHSPTRTLLTHVEKVTDSDGRFVKILGTCQDMSLLTTYAEHLQTAEEFVKAVVSHVEAGLIATDSQGKLTLINKSARKLHGYDEIDEHLPELFDLISSIRDMEDKTIEKEGTPVYRVLAGESVKNMQIKIVPVGKTLQEAVFLSCNGQLLSAPDGTKLGAVIALHNITEHKQAEQALRLAKEEAELASKLKSEFMANLSHEIRTPFNGILGMISLVMESDIPPVAREHLESALECTHFLLNIINTLLDFSKLETKHVELCPVPFLLRSSVGTILSLFEAQAREKKIVLELEVQGTVPDSLFGDVDRLRQIVTHLVDNSIKFSKPPGRVAVYIELASEQPPNPNLVQLCFKIEDNGIGIPETKQKLLFGSFYQVDGSSTRQQGGVGLGLAICENLVGLFNGKIWCTSVEGQGSTFYFTVQLERPSRYLDKFPYRHRRSVSTSVIEAPTTPPLNYVAPPLPTSIATPTSPTSSSSPTHSPFQSPMHSPRSSPTSFIGLRSSAPASLKARNSTPDSPVMLHQTYSPPINSPKSNSPSSPLQISLSNPNLSAGNAHFPHFDKRRFSYAGQSSPSSFSSSPKLNSPTTSSYMAESKLHILLCEDNTMNQKVVVRMLGKYGHEISIANDGREAVAMFEAADPENRFECVLMDIQMPHMNGVEAAHKIRMIEKEKGWPYIPIIAVSAYLEEKERFVEAGIDAYIAKPINQPILLETMYQLTLRYGRNSDSPDGNPQNNNDNNNNTTKTDNSKK